MSLGEFICLGIDAVILTVIYRLYKESAKNLQALKDAPTLEITQNLKSEVKKCAQECIPYVIVRGSVKAIDKPIVSKNVPDVVGVIHESILREHKIQWNWASRWWREVKMDLSRSKDSVPFVLHGNERGTTIEVLDVMNAQNLEMRTVFDEFKQNQAGFWNSLSRFFVGESTTGFQQIELMLTEGTTLTGVGALVLENGRLCLKPPDDGLPYYLTQMTEGALVKGLEKDVSAYKTITVMVGAFGGLLLTFILYKYYSRWCEQKLRSAELRKMADLIAENNRQAKERADDAVEVENPSSLCVVCQENPREVLILECGHLCCCNRCGQLLQPARCPVCRAHITRLVPAFVA